MMQDFDIQPLSEKDIPYVSRIMQMRWDVSPEWAQKEIEKFLIPTKERVVFCVHHEGNTVGVGLFDIHMDDVSLDYGPWLSLLWVDPEYRGHDLGIALTQKRMDHARKYGHKEVYIDTMDAEQYHLANGWEKVADILYKGEPDVILKYDLSKEFPRVL